MVCGVSSNNNFTCSCNVKANGSGDVDQPPSPTKPIFLDLPPINGNDGILYLKVNRSRSRPWESVSVVQQQEHISLPPETRRQEVPNISSSEEDSAIDLYNSSEEITISHEKIEDAPNPDMTSGSQGTQQEQEQQQRHLHHQPSKPETRKKEVSKPSSSEGVLAVDLSCKSKVMTIKHEEIKDVPVLYMSSGSQGTQQDQELQEQHLHHQPNHQPQKQQQQQPLESLHGSMSPVLETHNRPEAAAFLRTKNQSQPENNEPHPPSDDHHADTTCFPEKTHLPGRDKDISPHSTSAQGSTTYHRYFGCHNNQHIYSSTDRLSLYDGTGTSVLASSDGKPLHSRRISSPDSASMDIQKYPADEYEEYPQIAHVQFVPPHEQHSSRNQIHNESKISRGRQQQCSSPDSVISSTSRLQFPDTQMPSSSRLQFPDSQMPSASRLQSPDTEMLSTSKIPGKHYQIQNDFLSPVQDCSSYCNLLRNFTRTNGSNICTCMSSAGTPNQSKTLPALSHYYQTPRVTYPYPLMMPGKYVCDSPGSLIGFSQGSLSSPSLIQHQEPPSATNFYLSPFPGHAFGHPRDQNGNGAHNGGTSQLKINNTGPCRQPLNGSVAVTAGAATASFGTKRKKPKVLGLQKRCLECPATFRTSNNLARHMEAHGSYRRYKCPFCTCAYGSYYCFKSHLENAHGVKKDQSSHNGISHNPLTHADSQLHRGSNTTSNSHSSTFQTENISLNSRNPPFHDTFLSNSGPAQPPNHCNNHSPCHGNNTPPNHGCNSPIPGTNPSQDGSNLSPDRM